MTYLVIFAILMTVEKDIHFPSIFTPIISKALYQTLKMAENLIATTYNCCGEMSLKSSDENHKTILGEFAVLDIYHSS